MGAALPVPELGACSRFALCILDRIAGVRRLSIPVRHRQRTDDTRFLLWHDSHECCIEPLPSSTIESMALDEPVRTASREGTPAKTAPVAVKPATLRQRRWRARRRGEAIPRGGYCPPVTRTGRPRHNLREAPEAGPPNRLGWPDEVCCSRNQPQKADGPGATRGQDSWSFANPPAKEES